MVLVDTSVWIEHFRSGGGGLAARLATGEVVCHPFVIGELACGNLGNRREILELLHNLPSAAVAGHDEVLRCIEQHRLMCRGLGYVDMHLLASALLGRLPLWTLDRRLHEAAEQLRVAAPAVAAGH